MDNDYMENLVDKIEVQMGDEPTLALPSVEMLNDYRLLEARKIFLGDEVSLDTVAIFKQILLWNMEDAGKTERKPIWLYIFNYGGDADVMFALIDIIERSETPVYTVNLGQCCSAAALIFIAGKKRFMLPMAKVMIHQGSAAIQGDAGKLLDASDSYKKLLRKMNEFIASHTGITPQQLGRKKANDWELNAEECLQDKVCDTIISSISEII